MKTNIIDDSKFPRRAVTSVRDARPGNPALLSHFVMLECGHEIGVKVGALIPGRAGCYECSKKQ